MSILANWLVYSVFRLPSGSRTAEALHFFIYDSIKIILLLFLMISVVGYLRTFIPAHKVRQWLSQRGGSAYILAALFGAITPFCSCSSIPIFLSFLEAGVPLGVAFSFLITSPMINEYLVVLMLGFFGWKITVIYIASGISIGIISGILLSRMKLEKHLCKDIFDTKYSQEDSAKDAFKSLKDRAAFGINEASSIIKRLWPWILLGVGIGAIIHNYVPQSTVHSLIAKTGNLSVPIATVLGVPMYGSCAAIVPVAVALFRKGIPLGTALAFMMATAALSLPEAVILRRAMKLKLIAIFFSITASGIIFTGYLFNFLEKIVR